MKIRNMVRTTLIREVFKDADKDWTKGIIEKNWFRVDYFFQWKFKTSTVNCMINQYKWRNQSPDDVILADNFTAPKHAV